MFTASALAATVVACSSSDGVAPNQTPYRMRAVDSTTPRIATVATPVYPVPVVQVRDNSGKLTPGITVTFTADGGGAVAVSSAQTDALGLASAGSWTLGTKTQIYTVVASAANANTATWKATATPGAPVSITVAPPYFTMFAGDSLLLIVSGLDQYGNATFRPPSTFLSADPAVASVTSPQGMVYPATLGKTSITARSGTGTAMVPVNVPTRSQATASGIGSFGIAVSANNVAYVVKPNTALLERYDLPSHVRTATIPLGFAPVDVSFVPDGSKAYVTDIGAANIYVLDVGTNTVTATIPMAGVSNRVLASPGGTKVYATVGNELVSINTATNVVTPVFTADATLQGMTFHPTLPWLYVSSSLTIYELDPAADIVRRSVTIGASVGVQDIAFSADGRRLFVSDETGGTQVLDGTTLAVINTLSSITNVFGLKVTKDGSKIWFTRPTSGGPIVMILDESTYETLESFNLLGARRIAFDKSGNTAIITADNDFLTFVTWP